ncbi:unnamed protein product, partial [Rotaria sordida]
AVNGTISANNVIINLPALLPFISISK